MVKGRIKHTGEGSFLVLSSDDVDIPDNDFEVDKVKDGVYELVDERELIINGLVVDFVLAKDNNVTEYLESVSPDEAEDVVVD